MVTHHVAAHLLSSPRKIWPADVHFLLLIVGGCLPFITFKHIMTYPRLRPTLTIVTWLFICYQLHASRDLPSSISFLRLVVRLLSVQRKIWPLYVHSFPFSYRCLTVIGSLQDMIRSSLLGCLSYNNASQNLTRSYSAFSFKLFLCYRFCAR